MIVSSRMTWNQPFSFSTGVHDTTCALVSVTYASSWHRSMVRRNEWSRDSARGAVRVGLNNRFKNQHRQTLPSPWWNKTERSWCAGQFEGSCENDLGAWKVTHRNLVSGYDITFLLTLTKRGFEMLIEHPFTNSIFSFFIVFLFWIETSIPLYDKT